MTLWTRKKDRGDGDTSLRKMGNVLVDTDTGLQNVRVIPGNIVTGTTGVTNGGAVGKVVMKRGVVNVIVAGLDIAQGSRGTTVVAAAGGVVRRHVETIDIRNGRVLSRSHESWAHAHSDPQPKAAQ